MSKSTWCTDIYIYGWKIPWPMIHALSQYMSSWLVGLMFYSSRFCSPGFCFTSCLPPLFAVWNIMVWVAVVVSSSLADLDIYSSIWSEMVLRYLLSWTLFCHNTTVKPGNVWLDQMNPTLGTWGMDLTTFSRSPSSLCLWSIY